jgi:hypothetical protein
MTLHNHEKSKRKDYQPQLNGAAHFFIRKSKAKQQSSAARTEVMI